MIDLARVSHVYLYPGKTDFRLGINGLRKLIARPEPGCLYVFANRSATAIKAIETGDGCCWLYEKKIFSGRFLYPSSGARSELTKEEVTSIIEGISIVSRIESGGKRKIYASF